MKIQRISNICIIAGNYPTKDRPVFIFVQQLVEALVDSGVNISVIAPQSLTRSLFRNIPILPREEIYRTENGNTYVVYRPYSITFGNGHKWLYSIANRFNQGSINHYLNRINPQIIYGHFWENAMKVMAYAVSHNKPLFVACGEGDNALDDWASNLPDSQKADIRKHVTGVISVSSENMRKCIDYNLCTKDNVIVLHNCVNTNLFRQIDASSKKKELGIKETDFVIVFVGGFIPRKGPDRLAKAISKLNDPHIKVMFIGNIFNGYDYDFGCPGIIYKGPTNHDELPLLLNCADVFVLPTQKEGCSNAIIEALACGLPVISSDEPFNDDILDDKNSIRINPNDVDALSKVIAYLRDNPQELHKMTETSLNRHCSYSIENRAANILQFIECFL